MKNLAMIPICAMNKDYELCRQFEATLTTKGICYVFNDKSFHEKFRPSEYVQNFEAVHQPKNETFNIHHTSKVKELNIILNGHYYNNPSNLEDKFYYNTNFEKWAR